MLTLTGKNVVVIGGSRGVGRRVVETAARSGARVLAVARGQEALDGLKRSVPGVETLAVDASEEAAPSKVFEAASHPHILVLCAGAFPPAAPLHEQTWKEFSASGMSPRPSPSADSSSGPGGRDGRQSVAGVSDKALNQGSENWLGQPVGTRLSIGGGDNIG